MVDPRAEAVLEILPRWVAALAGIEGFSRLLVVFWLDRARRPRRLDEPIRPEGREDVPPVGLFATRSPHRPIPLSLAAPRLLLREAARLVVSGIDTWDGTPGLDIKGCSPRDDMRPDARVPDWLETRWLLHDEERAHGLPGNHTATDADQDPARGSNPWFRSCEAESLLFRTAATGVEPLWEPRTRQASRSP